MSDDTSARWSAGEATVAGMRCRVALGWDGQWDWAVDLPGWPLAFTCPRAGMQAEAVETAEAVARAVRDALSEWVASGAQVKWESKQVVEMHAGQRRWRDKRTADIAGMRLELDAGPACRPRALLHLAARGGGVPAIAKARGKWAAEPAMVEMLVFGWGARPGGITKALELAELHLRRAADDVLKASAGEDVGT